MLATGSDRDQESIPSAFQAALSHTRWLGRPSEVHDGKVASLGSGRKSLRPKLEGTWKDSSRRAPWGLQVAGRAGISSSCFIRGKRAGGLSELDATWG